MHIYTFFVNNIIGDNMRKIKADYYLLVLLFIMFIVSLLSLYNADLINGNVDNILRHLDSFITYKTTENGSSSN